MSGWLDGDRPTTPIDLMLVYLTASMGVGQRLSLDEIDDVLSTLPLRLTLELLSMIAFRADASVGDRAAQIEFTRHLLPPPDAALALALMEARPELVPPSSQLALNLALRALASCSDVSPEAWEADSVAHQLGLLLLALADHNAAGLDSAEALALEIARLKLYYGVQDLSAWYEIALGLLFEEPPQLEGHPDHVDLDAVIRARYGMSLALFWSLTVFYGLVAQQEADFHWVPHPLEGSAVEPAEVARWAEAWTIELSEAQALATQDLAHRSWWSFSAFFERPVVRLNDQGGAVMRPAFLAMRARPAGMFWAIRHPYVAAGGDHLRLSRFFGRLVENHGHRLAERHLPNVERLDEATMRRRWGAGQTCDMLLICPEWVPVEFVHRLITRASSATGNFNDLMTDVRVAVIEKLQQIDATLARALDQEPTAPAAIYPIVVVGAPFPHDRLVLDPALDELDAQSPLVVGVHPNCKLPAVLDLAEYSTLLQASAYLGTTITTLFQSWNDSGMAGDSFRQWLTTDGPGGEVPGGGAISRGWNDLVRACVFRPGDGGAD